MPGLRGMLGAVCGAGEMRPALPQGHTSAHNLILICVDGDSVTCFPFTARSQGSRTYSKERPKARWPPVLVPSEPRLTFRPSPSLPEDPKGLQPFGKVSRRRWEVSPVVPLAPA